MGPYIGRVAQLSITRLRWWHIDDLLPLEVDLFGPERWTAACSGTSSPADSST